MIRSTPAAARKPALARPARDDEPDAVSASSDPVDKLLAFLREKISDDDMAMVVQIIADLDGYTVVGDSNHRLAADSISSNRNYGAMDYTTRKAVKAMNAIQRARDEVRPVVGEIPAMDSTGKVYLEAVKRLGRPTKGLPEEAAEAAYKMLRQLATNPPSALGMDAASVGKRLEMFPNFNRLGGQR